MMPAAFNEEEFAEVKRISAESQQSGARLSFQCRVGRHIVRFTPDGLWESIDPVTILRAPADLVEGLVMHPEFQPA
jgi:hypothetical protein